MNDAPWLLRIENGLSAHFKMPDGPSRPGTLWSVGLTRGDETYATTVKALLTNDATPATRANSQYQAQTTMQYLNDELNKGWHPSQEREHVIHIGNPLVALPEVAAGGKPWWKFW
jgi:hypothetical protein